LEKVKERFKGPQPDNLLPPGFPEDAVIKDHLPMWGDKIWIPEDLQEEAIKDIH
jgi:hypothetical protein